MRTILALFFVGIILALNACSPVRASGERAEVIAAPLSGYTCFAIKNGAGETVGGNCVKD